MLRALLRCLFAPLFSLTVLLPGTAAADTLTLQWSRNSEADVSGYVVLVGTRPGEYDQSVDVGNADSFTLPQAVPGQRYHFAVLAYSGNVFGALSAELSGYSNEYPVLANPGNQFGTAGQLATLQLVGTDALGDALVYEATGLPAGVTLSRATGLLSGTPAAAGIFVVTASASDGVLSTSQSFVWTVAASGVAVVSDPPAPTIVLPAVTHRSGVAVSRPRVSTPSTRVATGLVARGRPAVEPPHASSPIASGTAVRRSATVVASPSSSLSSAPIAPTAHPTVRMLAPGVAVGPTKPAARTPPLVTIQTPVDGATLDAGSLVMLMASSSGGSVTDARLEWTSNIDGALGTGSSMVVPLSHGTHVITASLSGSGQISAAVTVAVSGAGD